MSQRFIQRGRVRIAYELLGDGPLVALVQGLGLPGRMWLGLSGGLVKSGHSVIVPDNRGTGSSDAPLPPYRMGTLADDLAAVLEDAARGPALVVGISLGGMIAQHLALRHPRRVSGLVLAATTCGPPVGTLPNLRLLPPMVRSLAGDARALGELRRLLVNPQTLARTPRLFDEWDRQMSRQAWRWSGFAGQLAAAALHSTGLSLGRVRCPVEVIAGDADRIVPPVNSRILARRIPAAALTLVPGAGHAFPLEAPAALPAAIRRVAARIAVS
jgi:pimeloyl-ACP methyl ester carboxylesterase